MHRVGAVVFCAAWTLLLCVSTAVAQGVEGSWQGTLEAGKSLRLVIRVTAAGGGNLSAMMFSIDQGAQGIAASAVTVRATAVTFTFGAISASFDGTVSSDGRSMTGTWRQGSGALPLTLVRTTPDTAWALPAPPQAMAADAPAVFEVATVKPSKPDQPGKLLSWRGRQLLTINTTLTDLMTFAYGVQARQIIGGTAWMADERYDLTAQPEAQGQPSQEQLRAMIRALLTDRFQLSLHRETRELPVYALVVAPGGPKPALAKNETNRKGLPGLFFKAPGVLPAVNATLADLAGVLQAVVLDRPVVDRTGLVDRYDFTLTWTPDESQFAAFGPRPPVPADPNGPPGLFTAIQEQLGIRLDSTRAPVEALVIDRVERPAAN